MYTTVTERGQISIPAAIRQKYHLKAGMEIEWLEAKGGIFLMPVPADPIAAFRGSGKTSTTELLQARQLEKENGERKTNNRKTSK